MKGIKRERRGTDWGKIREGDKTWEVPNSGKQTKGCGRGGGGGDGVTGWWALRRALDGMSTGYYTICWQIEFKLKNKQQKIKVPSSTIIKICIYHKDVLIL